MTHYHLLNPERRMIACFSPKAACTTLKSWFCKSLGPPTPLTEEDVYRAVVQHMIDACRIQEHDGVHRILFVRDPFCRLVGYYCKFVVPGRDNPWIHADHGQSHSILGKTFAEFVTIAHTLHCSGIGLQHHLQPQTPDVSHIEFHTVIAVERLDRDLPVLNKRLGFDCAVQRLNATVRSDDNHRAVFDVEPEILHAEGMPRSQCFYNRELIALVEDIYAADIDYYESRFGPCIVRSS